MVRKPGNTFLLRITCAIVSIFVAEMQISYAQNGYWQQRINYKMEVELDVETNQVKGNQRIIYFNQSPDTLYRLFFHTFWNAFQPGSRMDKRSREFGTIEISKSRDGKPKYDWDTRIGDRIGKLLPEEQGFTRIQSLNIDGKPQHVIDHETIAEVLLEKPIAPGKQVTVVTNWTGQVPLQIRRSGRDNTEGVRFTMTQWYPKMASYDADGWHPDFYTGREFYGVWGDFDVRISMNKDYKIGSSGVLHNAMEIGWGYDKEGTPLKPIKSPLRTWHFKAENVHDFAWAADTSFVHITRKTDNGPLLHFIFKNGPQAGVQWGGMADTCAMVYPFIRDNFGPYPWSCYSFIQGGDGGMEYAMATMIQNSSLTTAIHEWLHSWYQHLLGTNENRYAWMDEGFTSFAQNRVLAFALKSRGLSHLSSVLGYQMLATSKFEEPLITNANYLTTNYAYNFGSYSKGAMFLVQLGYIMGEENLSKTLLEYYKQWKFKSPGPNDFVRIAEKVSKMELDWYQEYWINTIKSIDYKIDTVWQENGTHRVSIYRSGDLPMPLDVTLTFSDSTTETHYIPLDLMFGKKPAENNSPRIVYPPQNWTRREIRLESKKTGAELTKVEIDPSMRMGDINKKNNSWERK